jgi:hypothetical protein
MFQKFWKKVQHLWLWAAGEAGGAAAGWLAVTSQMFKKLSTLISYVNQV